ncbi:MAG TPA: helix-turn-helix transcriptional regulator [Clostridiales bacterium]|nr:helix-turn-helix transcriptional regulator [Clostridiales bacterium]
MSNESLVFSFNELTGINSTIDEMYGDMAYDRPLHVFIQAFLERICSQIYYDKANFILIDYNAPENHYEVNTFYSLGWDEHDVDVYKRNYFEMDDVIPILMRKEHIAFRNNDLFSTEERKKTLYYREFVEPAYIQTSIDANIVLPDHPNSRIIAGFFRDPGKKEFSTKELELIKIYQPHLANIFNNYLRSEESSMHELLSIMDIVDSIGICVLDSSYNIQLSNSAFRRFIEKEDGLNKSICEGRLTKRIQQLCSLISNTGDEKIGPFDYTTAKDSYLIEIANCTSSLPRQKFCATVYSSSQLFMYRFSLLKKKYNLTPREYEVIVLMTGKGMSAEQIATELFISTSTVKKHISSAYQKMEIGTQKQLLSLLNLL